MLSLLNCATITIMQFKRISITPIRSLCQATANLLSVSVDLPFLAMPWKWNHTLCGLLCPASATLQSGAMLGGWTFCPTELSAPVALEGSRNQNQQHLGLVPSKRWPHVEGVGRSGEKTKPGIGIGIGLGSIERELTERSCMRGEFPRGLLSFSPPTTSGGVFMISPLRLLPCGPSPGSPF